LPIIGTRCEGEVFYIATLFWSQFTNEWIRIRFLVDTGSTFTTLSNFDARKNNINYKALESDKVLAEMGDGSEASTRTLDNCVIALPTEEDVHLIEQLDKVKVFDKIEKGRPQSSFLGIDILTRFRISFEGDLIILEK
jgi:predicted aspartyl protease